MGSETTTVKKRLLLSKWHENQWAGADNERYSDIVAHRDELESALLAVRYWLHDGLVFGRLVSNPRDILRKVEEVL